jgi:hypothetical protein
MTLTKFEELNKIMCVIDACQTDCKIDFSFNLPKEFYDLTNPENKKGLAVKNYLDENFLFVLTKYNKNDLLRDLASNFESGEICHYKFLKGSIKIGEGFDYCEINFLDPDYFQLTQEHLNILGDVDIEFKKQIR